MEELVIITACLIANGFLAAFEMAFVSVPRSALHKAARQGSRAARWALARRDAPERTLSVIQIGITLVGAIAATVGGVGAAETLQPYFMNRWGLGEIPSELLSVVLVVLPLTYVTVVLGELTPKALALRAPMGIVTRGSRWISLADRALSPVVSLLEWSTRTLLNRIIGPMTSPPPHTDTTLELDSLEPTHQQAVLNLAHIERRRLSDILVPWKDVTYVETSQTMEDIVPIVFASGHTRLPVVEGGRTIGVLHTKEFLGFREQGQRNWLSIVRPILRAMGTDSILSALSLMQRRRSHLAAVVSPSGECEGIVTMEDIIEEFLGDIYDEDEHSRIRRLFADRVKNKGLNPGGLGL